MAPLRIAAGPAPGEPTRAAARLMERFAERTRLGDPQGTRRYLWTDAFAVCNFLALGRLTGHEPVDPGAGCRVGLARRPCRAARGDRIVLARAGASRERGLARP